MLERQQRRIEAAVAPRLDDGERMTAAFVGQTPIPPIAYLLVGPLLFLFMVKVRTIVVTGRNLYVFSNRWMRSYSYTDEAPYKVGIAQARLESGSMWARVDGGPKLWTAPFGPLRRSLRRLEHAAFESRARELRTDKTRERGFGTTPL
ncbi:MAG: hypothetical protein ACR2GL_02310 [Thermoleophilaceae bacterium]